MTSFTVCEQEARSAGFFVFGAWRGGDRKFDRSSLNPAGRAAEMSSSVEAGALVFPRFLSFCRCGAGLKTAVGFRGADSDFSVWFGLAGQKGGIALEQSRLLTALSSAPGRFVCMGSDQTVPEKFQRTNLPVKELSVVREEKEDEVTG